MNALASSALRVPRLSAIVLGGSAGGIEAVSTLLSALPERLDVPVLVALHIKADSKAHWPLVFRASRAPVFEAEDGQLARPGSVYVAPPDYHLLVDVDSRLSLSAEERVNMARPSLDVLFESAAWAYEGGALGVVLSGANADGAAGLAAIRAHGGRAWVQSPETALASMMPRAALVAVPDALELSLSEMAEALASWEP
jgi:two-component system chemotaxis response regulator CheB